MNRMDRLDSIEEYPEISPRSEAHERFRRKLRLHLLTHNLVTDDIRFETFMNRTLETPSLSHWTFFHECNQFAENASPCTKATNQISSCISRITCFRWNSNRQENLNLLSDPTESLKREIEILLIDFLRQNGIQHPSDETLEILLNRIMELLLELSD